MLATAEKRLSGYLRARDVNNNSSLLLSGISLLHAVEASSLLLVSPVTEAYKHQKENYLLRTFYCVKLVTVKRDNGIMSYYVSYSVSCRVI